MSLLSEQQILNNLKNINGWNYENNSIHKIFVHKNFSDAVAFIVKVGIESEKIDHHPDCYCTDGIK
jgi:4a-hydroxytetrahydrobiopterin dehydratase